MFSVFLSAVFFRVSLVQYEVSYCAERLLGVRHCLIGLTWCRCRYSCVVIAKPKGEASNLGAKSSRVCIYIYFFMASYYGYMYRLEVCA